MSDPQGLYIPPLNPKRAEIGRLCDCVSGDSSFTLISTSKITDGWRTYRFYCARCLRIVDKNMKPLAGEKPQ